jgi:hypothetical protein
MRCAWWFSCDADGWSVRLRRECPPRVSRRGAGGPGSPRLFGWDLGACMPCTPGTGPRLELPRRGTGDATARVSRAWPWSVFSGQGAPPAAGGRGAPLDARQAGAASSELQQDDGRFADLQEVQWRRQPPCSGRMRRSRTWGPRSLMRTTTSRAILGIAHQHAGAERKRPVGRRQGIHVEALAARRALAVASRARTRRPGRGRSRRRRACSRPRAGDRAPACVEQPASAASNTAIAIQPARRAGAGSGGDGRGERKVHRAPL